MTNAALFFAIPGLRSSAACCTTPGMTRTVIPAIRFAVILRCELRRSDCSDDSELRRMRALTTILRDAVLRTAPQDDGVSCRGSSAASLTATGASISAAPSIGRMRSRVDPRTAGRLLPACDRCSSRSARAVREHHLDAPYESARSPHDGT
jgi:hypothetical protein